MSKEKQREKSGRKPFKYKAINTNGRVVQGVLMARDPIDLHLTLENMNLSLIKGSEITQKKSIFSEILPPRLTLRMKMQFYFQLLQLQGAGITLLDSLHYCRQSFPEQNFVDVLNQMYQMVYDGQSLSESLSQFPRYFSQLEIAIIRTSEGTGNMQDAYKYLLDFIKKSDELNSRIKKATRYPIILVSVIVLAVFVLMGYVVPQIAQFLKTASNIELPVYTIILMNISDFFANYSFHMAIIFIAMVFIYGLLRRLSYGFKRRTDLILLNMPLAGELIRKAEIARFVYTAAALYEAGIPILKAIENGRDTVNNSIIKEALNDAEKKIAAGMPIARAFDQTGEFQSIVIQMLDIGEQSGNISKSLAQVAELYNKDVEESIQMAVDLIEPALTMVMAVIIFWIIVAVFGPIYSMFEQLDV